MLDIYMQYCSEYLRDVSILTKLRCHLAFLLILLLLEPKL